MSDHVTALTACRSRLAGATAPARPARCPAAAGTAVTHYQGGRLTGGWAGAGAGRRVQYTTDSLPCSETVFDRAGTRQERRCSVWQLGAAQWNAAQWNAALWNAALWNAALWNAAQLSGTESPELRLSFLCSSVIIKL